MAKEIYREIEYIAGDILDKEFLACVNNFTNDLFPLSLNNFSENELLNGLRRDREWITILFMNFMYHKLSPIKMLSFMLFWSRKNDVRCSHFDYLWKHISERCEVLIQKKIKSN